MIGAGPIGCELAQAFGCGKNLRESKDVDCKRLTVDSLGKHYDLAVDEILASGGRMPNVEDLGLETVGVEYDKKGVKVNDQLQTTNPRIYAAGDICSKYQFTHAADALARIVLQNALFSGRAKASALTMPWCTYTDPEIAHVGLYEKEAQEQGIPVQTFIQQLDEVDRAVLDGESEGFVKVHIRKGTDRILGATVVARHAGEMILELTLSSTSDLYPRELSASLHTCIVTLHSDATFLAVGSLVPEEARDSGADVDSTQGLILGCFAVLKQQVWPDPSKEYMNWFTDHDSVMRYTPLLGTETQRSVMRGIHDGTMAILAVGWPAQRLRGGVFHPASQSIRGRLANPTSGRNRGFDLASSRDGLACRAGADRTRPTASVPGRHRTNYRCAAPIDILESASQ